MIFVQPDNRYADMHFELAQRFPHEPTLHPWQVELVGKLQEEIKSAKTGLAKNAFLSSKSAS